MFTDRLFAALMFFTRLPLWRIHRPRPESFGRVVDFWPVAGWFTGGTMSVVFWWCSQHFPALVAALMAVAARMLLTGALHEDALADFFDGFGGGTTRERILAIMKDSRTGTYGVLALVMHTALLVALLAALPRVPAVVFTADVYAKACGSMLIAQLPYARTAESAKSGVVYRPWHGRGLLFHLLRCVVAVLPGVVWLYSVCPGFAWWAFLVPPVVEVLLMLRMKRRLGGYTGDCCGAVFLLCELSFYAAAAFF